MTNHTKKTRKFTTKNINKLKSLINTFDWSYIYSDININILVDTFISDLYILFNLYCPKVSIKSKYKNRKPWLCPNVLKWIFNKNELYKNYLQNINSETNFNLSIIYTKYKNILTSVLRKAEALHYSNYLMSKSNDSKATWNIINNLLKTNKTKLSLSGDLPDPYTFNDYFNNIGSKLSNII